MRVCVVSGIYPPDIGGPATHAADLVEELEARGHRVTVLTLSDDAHATSGPVVRFPRAWPWPARMLAVVAWLVGHRRRIDAVYATGLGPAAVVGAMLARRPVVLKIVGDPAWERGRRRGLTGSGFDEFQSRAAGAREPLLVRSMKAMRGFTVRNADVVVTPSDYLARVVRDWAPGQVEPIVVPNGVRALDVSGAPTRAGVLYVGRLVGHKRVDRLVQAVAAIPGLGLDVIGDGPERATLEALAEQAGAGDRVRFLGALDHGAVLERMRSATALVSASEYEGLPHVVIEAMAVGTPVVTTAAGGSTEVVVDDVNGLVVGDDDASLAGALRRVSDPDVHARLAAGAAATGAAWRFERTADDVERILRRLVEPRPVVVAFGRTAVPDPPGDDLRRKLALHHERFDQVSINVGPWGRRVVEGATLVGVPRTRPPIIGAVAFYALGSALAVALTAGSRRRRRRAVVCQSPFEAVGVLALSRLLPASSRPRVQVELHGDWRTGPRLYGGRLRSLVAGPSDRLSAWAVRRADRVRAVSHVLVDLAAETGYTGPIDRFITFSDYREFLEAPLAPLPERPVAVFVGVHERYKAVDVLVDAWGDVVAALPDAELHMVGRGSMTDQLKELVDAKGLGSSVRFVDPMPRADLARYLDGATCLVLPSRSEGLARIVFEAMARARPVVASRVGGITECIQDGVNGELVPCEDVLALADALIRVLGDRERATSMGERARQVALARDPLAEYRGGIDRLADWVAAG